MDTDPCLTAPAGCTGVWWTRVCRWSRPTSWRCFTPASSPSSCTGAACLGGDPFCSRAVSQYLRFTSCPRSMRAPSLAVCTGAACLWRRHHRLLSTAIFLHHALTLMRACWLRPQHLTHFPFVSSVHRLRVTQQTNVSDSSSHMSFHVIRVPTQRTGGAEAGRGGRRGGPAAGVCGPHCRRDGRQRRVRSAGRLGAAHGESCWFLGTKAPG